MMVKFTCNSEPRECSEEEYARKMSATRYEDDRPDNYEPPYQKAIVSNDSFTAYCAQCCTLWAGCSGTHLEHRCRGGVTMTVQTMHHMYVVDSRNGGNVSATPIQDAMEIALRELTAMVAERRKVADDRVRKLDEPLQRRDMDAILGAMKRLNRVEKP